MIEMILDFGFWILDWLGVVCRQGGDRLWSQRVLNWDVVAAYLSVGGAFQSELPDSSASPPPSSSTNPDRRPLRVVLLGDREDVMATIKNLHRRGFAEVGDWSKAIACPNTGEVVNQVLLTLPTDSVVSILTKYLS